MQTIVSHLWDFLETRKAMWLQWISVGTSAFTLSNVLTALTIIYTILLIVAHVRKEYFPKRK